MTARDAGPTSSGTATRTRPPATPTTNELGRGRAGRQPLQPPARAGSAPKVAPDTKAPTTPVPLNAERASTAAPEAGGQPGRACPGRGGRACSEGGQRGSGTSAIDPVAYEGGQTKVYDRTACHCQMTADARRFWPSVAGSEENRMPAPLGSDPTGRSTPRAAVAMPTRVERTARRRGQHVVEQRPRRREAREAFLGWTAPGRSASVR